MTSTDDRDLQVKKKGGGKPGKGDDGAQIEDILHL
jgi:hypothetical protein